MASATWGRGGRNSGPATTTSSGLCVVGSACRFGSSREVVAAADSRLIRIQVEGEEVLVDRYDVRLLLGDVAAFARQNCSEDRRLEKLQESREIEDMRYEDLPRRAAFSDDLPPPQQQEQWTPTLEQQQKQQKKHRGISGSAAATATSLQDSAQPAEEGGADFSAVPPPDALDAPEVASGTNQADSSASPPQEGTAAAAVATKEGPAEECTERNTSDAGAAGADAEQDHKQDQPHKQQQKQQQKDEDCFTPPFPDLPPDIRLPESLREYLVVERTAHFVREEGDRMEFRLLLDEERRLPFLAASHRLHPIYSWLKQKGHSLVSWAGEMLPARIRALLTFAYSLNPASDLQKQQQQQQKQMEPETQPAVKGDTKHQAQQQPQQPEQRPLDPDGGLGLLLSYGSDEEEDAAPEQQQENEQQKQEQQQENEQQKQEQQQEQHTAGSPQQQKQQREDIKEEQQASPTAVIKKRPPPAPPLPASVAPLAAATPTSENPSAEGDSADSGGEEATDNPKDLTSIWRHQRLTRFSLKRQKREKIELDELEERADPAEDIETQLAALPQKPPWALPNAKLGLSKASCLAIQQLGHHLLSAGDLSLIQHAKTYEDDASPFPFLRTSSMDLRYFRYVLKCVETEVQKEGFVKPQPLPGPTHELARSFLARLQLNHHLQQRKKQLLQQCMRLSEVTPDDPSLDYLKTVETAAAVAAAGGAAGDGTGNNRTITEDSPTAATAAAPESSAEAATDAPAMAAAADNPTSAAYMAAAQSQIPPETAAHLQLLLQQMAAASAADDAATYMACYTAYCYAVAALSPDAAAAAAASTSVAAPPDTKPSNEGGPGAP